MANWDSEIGFAALEKTSIYSLNSLWWDCLKIQRVDGEIALKGSLLNGTTSPLPHLSLSGVILVSLSWVFPFFHPHWALDPILPFPTPPAPSSSSGHEAPLFLQLFFSHSYFVPLTLCHPLPLHPLLSGHYSPHSVLLTHHDTLLRLQTVWSFFVLSLLCQWRIRINTHSALSPLPPRRGKWITEAWSIAPASYRPAPPFPLSDVIHLFFPSVW